MAQLKHLSDNVLITVSEKPVWVSGIWECGDQRFMDEHEKLYAAVADTPIYADMTPLAFLQCFTAIERIKIKMLATTGIPAQTAVNPTSTAIPADIFIADFWEVYQATVVAGRMISPSSPAFQAALAYMVAPVISTTPPIITAARIPEISAGIQQ